MHIPYFVISFFILLSNSMYITCEETTTNHTITIFVHGTTPARKFLQYTPLRPLIYCPQGISLIKNLPKHYHFHKMAQGCVDRNPKDYSLDQFYIFGWKSEYVYNAMRIQAAQDLVQSLQALVKKYHTLHNIIPSIQLIGFSHGGNVILHTANYLPLFFNEEQVNIDVWLFGTPVQQINQELVNSIHFNKVYSVYSKKDWLQRMDPQGIRDRRCRKHHFWSDRTFNPSHRCIQAHFTVNNKSISHRYYRSIFKHFPTIQEIIKLKSKNSNSKMISINLEI